MLEFNQKFSDIELKNLYSEVESRRDKGWRYVQTLAKNTDNGIDLIYSFMKNGLLDNLKVKSVTSKDKVKSINDLYIESFVWENEIHDLFGVNFVDMEIDFKGKFYNVAKDKPMTIVEEK